LLVQPAAASKKPAPRPLTSPITCRMSHSQVAPRV